MEVVGGLAALSFDRRQEEAADRFGLRVVQQEYGHVAGSLDFFTRLDRQEEEGGGRITAYFASHPLSDQRIETMRTVAQERGWSFRGELLPLPGELSPQNEESEDDAVNDGADDLADGQRFGLVGGGYRFDMMEHLYILGGFTCPSPLSACSGPLPPGEIRPSLSRAMSEKRDHAGTKREKTSKGGAGTLRGFQIFVLPCSLGAGCERVVELRG